MSTYSGVTREEPGTEGHGGHPGGAGHRGAWWAPGRSRAPRGMVGTREEPGTERHGGHPGTTDGPWLLFMMPVIIILQGNSLRTAPHSEEHASNRRRTHKTQILVNNNNILTWSPRRSRAPRGIVVTRKPRVLIFYYEVRFFIMR